MEAVNKAFNELKEEIDKLFDNKLNQLTSQDKELIAKEWIRDNAHTALCEAIKIHDTFTNCKCIIDTISPLVKKAYDL